MHELTIAREVMRVLRASAAEESLDRIESVSLKVGVISCLHPAALRTAFSVLKTDDELLCGARLQVQCVPVVIRCSRCGGRWEVDPPEFLCPGCGSRRVRVLKGEEVIIHSYRGTRTGEEEGMLDEDSAGTECNAEVRH